MTGVDKIHKIMVDNKENLGYNTQKPEGRVRKMEENYLVRQEAARRMEHFVKKQDQVLICLPEQGLGQILKSSAQSLGANVTMPGGDYRWKSLMKMAFVRRVSVAVAPAMILLGLAKIARETHTPLYIRQAVLVGEECPDWMVRDIAAALDCKVQDFRDLRVPNDRCLRRLDPAEELVASIYSWNSVVDCRVHRGEYGLELELVVIPGRKLPKLPACGKMILRPWDPEEDAPMDPSGSQAGAKFFSEYH